MQASNSAMPLSALRLDRAFPSFVRGPVDLLQGCQRRIASACFARRSGVQDEEVPIPVSIVRFRGSTSDYCWVHTRCRARISAPANADCWRRAASHTRAGKWRSYPLRPQPAPGQAFPSTRCAVDLALPVARSADRPNARWASPREVGKLADAPPKLICLADVDDFSVVPVRCECVSRNGRVSPLEATARIGRQEGHWRAPGVGDDIDTASSRDRAAGARIREGEPAGEPLGFKRCPVKLYDACLSMPSCVPLSPFCDQAVPIQQAS